MAGNEKDQKGQQPAFNAEEIRQRAADLVAYVGKEEGIDLTADEIGLDVIGDQLTPDQVLEKARDAARKKLVQSRSAQQNLRAWAEETRRKHQAGED